MTRGAAWHQERSLKAGQNKITPMTRSSCPNYLLLKTKSPLRRISSEELPIMTSKVPGSTIN